MIFDRTQTDIDEARSIRNGKIKNFQELTQEDINILERGMLTVNTLNRIEQKQAELSQILSQYGYVANCVNKQWTNSDDIPRERDYLRILSNLDKLKEAFYIYSNTPDTPHDMLHYQHVNDVEKILIDIEAVIDNMKLSWIYPFEDSSISEYCGGGTQL